MKKLRVGVIFGGKSGEHEVSLASGSSIIKGLDKSKYDVIPICISIEGVWMTPSSSVELLKEKELLTIDIESLYIPPVNSDDPLELIKCNKVDKDSRIVDIAIPVLHGPFGEDGTIQGLFEMSDIPYLGAGVMASAVAMEKGTAKTIYKANGLPVCRYITIKRAEWNKNKKENIENIQNDIGFPLFVKPVNMGSSVGISKVKGIEDLGKACDLACKYDRIIIVEEAINAREIECSVLGNDEPICSVPGEIIPHNEFYDYDAKYTPGKTDIVIPAPLSEDKVKEIQSYSIRAFKCIDCCGMARADFLMDRESEKVYLSEINTIPGFTATSVYAKLFEASGLKYSELLDRLIELALERYKEKSSSQTYFF